MDCDYTVTGHITWSDGSPVAGVAVRAVDQDLRGEQPLGPYAPDFHQETLTDESGEYTIQYHREQYTRAEYGTADLVVRVLGGDGKPVATSPAHFNVPDEVTIDLVVSGAVPGQPSEWERVAAVVQQVVDDPAPAQLDELRPSDLDFLAGETGIARDKLSALIDALGLSRDARGWDLAIAPEAFYGLIREGLPSDWAGLAARNEVRAVLCPPGPGAPACRRTRWPPSSARSSGPRRAPTPPRLARPRRWRRRPSATRRPATPTTRSSTCV